MLDRARVASEVYEDADADDALLDRELRAEETLKLAFDTWLRPVDGPAIPATEVSICRRAGGIPHSQGELRWK